MHSKTGRAAFAAVTEWSSVASLEDRLGSRVLYSASQAARE